MSVARRVLRLPKTGVRSIETRIVPPFASHVEQRRPFRRAAPPSRVPRPSRPNDGSASSPPEPNDKANIGQNEAENQPSLNTQLATTLQQADSSDLVAEVRIPSNPNGVLPPDHPALSVLGNSSLVIQRQLEMFNVILGFEQANRYIVMDGEGQTIGYIAEQDNGFGKKMARQYTRTHRSFTVYVFDREEREVLRIHRPFAYINSRIRIYDPVPKDGFESTDSADESQVSSIKSMFNKDGVARPSPLKLEDMRVIGECQQRWSATRRKYELSTFSRLDVQESNALRIESGEKADTQATALTEAKAPEQAIEAGMKQFALIDEPMLSWDFTVQDESTRVIGSVNRNFAGFGRELFTDTGVYALRMDSAAKQSALETSDGREDGRFEAPSLTLDQRATMIATAVSIDFDYFSRHSSAVGSSFMPIFWPMGGGAAEGGAVGAGAGAAGGAAAGEAGAIGVGTAVEGAAGAAGRGVAGAGALEGGIAGAGTMAGYEAMQRGIYGGQGSQDDDPNRRQGSEPIPDSMPQGGGGGGGGGGAYGQADNQSPATNDDVWGTDQDPWSENTPGDGLQPPDGGSSGDGGGWLDWITDFFGGD